MPFRKVSVAAMVIVALVAVTSLLLCTYAAVNYLSVRDRVLADMRASLAQDADRTAISLALPIWNFDRPQMDKVVESMLRDGALVRIVVQSADGAVLIDAAKPQAGAAGGAAGSGSGPGSGNAAKPAQRGGILSERKDVVFSEQRLAQVTLYATTRLVEAGLKKTLMWTILNILALDVVLVLSLYLLLRIWVFNPLQEVEAYAATVSAGGKAGRVRPFRGELESLRSSIERMIGQLESRYAQVQTEIGERKRAEEDLRRVSERLSLATRAGGVGVWDWDLELGVLEWDDQMFSIYGIERDRFSGAYAAWRAGLLPEDSAIADASVNLALRGEKEFDTEFRILRPDGTIRNVRALASVTRNAAGKAVRMIGTNWDITDSKRIQESARLHEQRLIQSDKMNSLGMLVSGVAHEINNPNNLIMLNADILETFCRFFTPVLREYAEAHPGWTIANIPYLKMDGRIETLINGIGGGARRIKRIVDNLKDFARLDTGELAERIHIEKVVEAAVGIVESLIRKSTASFSVSHGTGSPCVKGNFQKLEQVVINLITNACQALEDRSRAIRITTGYESESDRVVLRVEDEGKGISKELLGKVVDPFFTTKRDTGGTGLGLSVSYGIIQEHKGEIRFESEPGRGTIVEIRIPAIR